MKKSKNKFSIRSVNPSTIKGFSSSSLKRKRLYIFLGAIIALIIIITLVRNSPGSSSGPAAAPDSNELLDSGEKADFGELEITVSPDITENSHSFPGVVDGQRGMIEVSIYSIYAKVFNPSAEEKRTFTAIKLVDDKGNEYKPDSNPNPAISLTEFGRDMNIYPITIREGNLIFLNVDENARKLKLVFEIGDKERVFEFDAP